MGKDEAAGEVEADPREEQGEEKMRCGELEDFLHATCMCSQLEEESASLYAYIVDKVVLGHLARHCHLLLVNFKELTNKEVAALLKVWVGEQRAGVTRWRERLRQLQRSRQDFCQENKTKMMMMMRRGSMML